MASRNEGAHTDPRTRAQKLADMADDSKSHSPTEAAIARRMLDEMVEREGASLSRTTVERAAAGLSAAARAYVIAEYERWAQAGRPRHTREWRA